MIREIPDIIIRLNARQYAEDMGDLKRYCITTRDVEQAFIAGAYSHSVIYLENTKRKK